MKTPKEMLMVLRSTNTKLENVSDHFLTVINRIRSFLST